MDPEEAGCWAWTRLGYRTLIRWENARRRRFGLVGCADDRWLRESGGRPSITPRGPGGDLRGPGRDAARGEDLDAGEGHEDPPVRPGDVRPRTSMSPAYDTLRRAWRDWFGPGGARQRYARSAELPEKNGHVMMHRPGQVVALDTTVLPVMVREGVFGEPVGRHLTLALDVCTHSLVAFRLTLVSDTSVDVAMLLRDVMMPLPMRADWGEDLEWPYPGPSGRGGGRVRRAPGRRAAVLHPGDRHHRPRQRLPKPPPA